MKGLLVRSLFVLGMMTLATGLLAAEAGREFTIATFNVDFANTNYLEVAEIIRKAKADIVCLQETTLASAKALRDTLGREYPVMKSHGGRGQDGFGLLSKLPVTKSEFVEPRHGLFGTLVAQFPLGKTNVQLAIVHLFPPDARYMDSLPGITQMFREADGIQRLEIGRVWDHLSTNMPALVLGDFNSFSFLGACQLLKNHGFTDSFAAVTDKPDSHGTWRCECRGNVWRFRIDYLWHSPQFQTLESRIIESESSDHHLLVSRLALREDKRLALTLGALNRDVPRLAPICFSLPRVLAAAGVVTTLQPTLDAQEHAALQRRVGILNEAATSLGL